MTYTVIIPIYNEERVLPLLLKQLNSLSNKIEVIIIDDGSDDNTHSILKKNKSFVTLRNKINRGKGFSIKRGLNIASNQNIILIDGDLEIDIFHIPKFIKSFEQSNKDVLVGSRWDKKNKTIFEINYIGNFLINKLFNILFKSNVSDVLCCLKILDRKTLKSLNLQSNNFSIEVETMAKLILGNFSIDESYIDYKRRTVKEGKKLKISDGWDIVLKMILTRFSKNI